MNVSMKGEKRKLSDIESEYDQSSQESCLPMQPFSDCVDDQSSPETCLPSQPLSDSDDDHSSPECLLLSQPLRDLYSSSNGANENQHNKAKSNSSKLDGSRKQIQFDELSAAEVVHLFDLDYSPQSPSQPDLTQVSVETVMEAMFTFVYHDNGETTESSKIGDKFADNENINVDGNNKNHCTGHKNTDNQDGSHSESGSENIEGLNETNEVHKNSVNKTEIAESEFDSDRNEHIDNNTSENSKTVSIQNPNVEENHPNIDNDSLSDGKNVTCASDNNFDGKGVTFGQNSKIINTKSPNSEENYPNIECACNIDGNNKTFEYHDHNNDIVGKNVTCDNVSHTDNTGGRLVTCEYTWRGSTMREVYRCCRHRVDWLQWMAKNDALNFKTCSRSEWIDRRRENKRVKLSGDDLQCSKVNHIIDLINVIKVQFCKNVCGDGEKMAEVFRLIGGILPRSANIRYGANAWYRFHYSGSEQTELDLLVRADCVYDIAHQSTDTTVAKLVAQIFTPVPGYKGRTTRTQQEFHHSEHMACVEKPARIPSSILDDKYEAVRQCVPSACSDCVNQMAGHHVVQLVCVAAEQKKKKLTDCTLYKAVGLFMKNERIYFSKLVIDDDKLESYTRARVIEGVDRDDCGESTSSKGQLSFSNWFIDLTVANHRIAFMTFLLMFLSREGA